MRRLGEDVSEVLEYVPARFKVIRQVRPKLSCAGCERIVQAPAPSRPIERGLAGPGLLAHVLVAKYCDHQPLYRQAEMYAREGVELERSTLADWVGGSSRLLEPLVEALRRHVMSAGKLHADDTPVPVLAPGNGKTKTGRLWTYVRDDRPAGDSTPAAVWFAYSPDRRGEHPRQHLRRFSGTLQADAYAGFHHLYDGGQIQEAACWAHVRRKFYELQVAHASPLAAEALKRIAELYAIEGEIRGRPPEERLAQPQSPGSPLLDSFHQWLQATLTAVSRKSEIAAAIRYALGRWRALLRYCEDGHIEIDNNAAERALRAVALGRKNYLFAGSDSGGERAAAIYSLIGTAKLNGLDPEAYLRGCWSASPTIPSTASLNCCPGTSKRKPNRSRSSKSLTNHSYRKCPSIFKWTLTAHTYNDLSLRFNPDAYGFPIDGEPTEVSSPDHRPDESPVGYSSAGWSPPEPASASPADDNFEGKEAV